VPRCVTDPNPNTVEPRSRSPRGRGAPRSDTGWGLLRKRRGRDFGIY